MGKQPAIYFKEPVEFLDPGSRFYKGPTWGPEEKLRECPGALAEKFIPPTKLPAPIRRKRDIAKAAGVAFFSGAIFGALLIVGLAWLAWALGV